MEKIEISTLLFGLGAIVVSAALTLVVRTAAGRLGFVAKPKSDRWHKRPTAMYGGVAIFLSTAILYLLFVPKSFESNVILAGSTFLFLVGLIDDLLNIKPYQKLIGQLFGAAIIVGFGLRLPLTGFELVDFGITVFWLVGITNAVNLLDNMDGLAAGIAAIAAIALAIGFAANGQYAEFALASVFIGTLLGFLVFNFNPASIFMGDCGSMFIGFLLASSVMLGQSGGRSRSILTIIAVPVLILFVPIFDTTFVTVIRKLWGRKASEGGRDHTSHRLVALGLTERNAVLMIYGFAATAGTLAILVGTLEPTQSIALISVFTIILSLIGVFLSKVKVYDQRQEELATQNNAVFAFLVDISYKRRIFEVMLDVVLITLSYYAAYVIARPGSLNNATNWELFRATLPLLIALKLLAFLLAGVYRGIWRYTSVPDLITFGKGVTAGSMLSVLAILLLYRFQNFSRAVFLLDGFILLFAIVGSRIAFRVFREMLPLPFSNEGRRVLIYGAGDGGEMVLRELRNNSEWKYQPVAFIDDDPLKKGKIINGLQVYDANGSLSDLCRDKTISEILVASRKIPPERLGELRELCRDSNISLMRAQIKIESLNFE
jgi:UDP-GlcNAc:undecaprenyl-phosphate/decaprenyl-phosphate GlcNAc-1-phosphate transferase